MGRNLLDMLGFNSDDPAVEQGRRHGAFIARLMDRLVGIREKYGLTQADVAARMGTTQSSVSNIERQAGDPRVSTLLRYADAVGAELDFNITGPLIGVTSGVAKPVEAGGSSRYTPSRLFTIESHGVPA